MLKYYAIKTSLKTDSSHSFVNICYRDWIPVFVNMIVADNPPLSSNKIYYHHHQAQRNWTKKKEICKTFARSEFNRLYSLHNPRLLHPRWVPHMRLPVSSFQKVLSQAFERILNTPLLKLKNNITLKLLLSFVDILEFWIFWHSKRKTEAREKIKMCKST